MTVQNNTTYYSDDHGVRYINDMGNFIFLLQYYFCWLTQCNIQDETHPPRGCIRKGKGRGTIKVTTTDYIAERHNGGFECAHLTAKGRVLGKCPANKKRPTLMHADTLDGLSSWMLLKQSVGLFYNIGTYLTCSAIHQDFWLFISPLPLSLQILCSDTFWVRVTCY